jgi:hypothetical protein
METKTERSNCHFEVQQASDGKPVLVLQLYQDSVPALKGTTLGFDLLGGISVEQAKKVAETLNEHVLDLFLITNGEPGEVG